MDNSNPIFRDIPVVTGANVMDLTDCNEQKDGIYGSEKGAVRKRSSNFQATYSKVNSGKNHKKKENSKCKISPSSTEQLEFGSSGYKELRKMPLEGNTQCSDINTKMNSVDNMRKSGKKKNKKSGNPVGIHTNVNVMGNFVNENQSQSPNPVKKMTPKCRSKTPDCKPANVRSPNPKRPLKFEPYIPLFEIQQGLKRGEFIEGALRINPRNYEDAYINAPDGKMDIYIGGIHDRNRALNGDIVVVQVNPKQEWKVLCDAIRDHQEKTGDNVVETVCQPVGSPNYCKIHTPDRFMRTTTGSSASWGSVRGERFPDSLEILGLDKLAQDFREISIKCKKQSKCTKKKSRSKGSDSSFSQGSSEDYLDKMSPERSSSKSCPTNFMQSSSGASTQSKNVDDDKWKCVNAEHNGSKSVDETNVKTFLPQMSANNTSSWDDDVPSVNIMISPETLLNNEYFQWRQKTESDYSDSEDVGVCVPPEDLSGDEFTDSVSVGSRDSNDLDFPFENTVFVNSEQDSENNNVNQPAEIITGINIMPQIEIFNTLSSQSSTVNYQCKLQDNIVNSSIDVFQASEESVICPAVISKVDCENYNSSSEENVICSPVKPISSWDIGPYVEEKVTANVDKCSVGEKSKSKRKKKKNKNKQDKVDQEQLRTEETVKKHNATLISSLSVEDIMKHPNWPNFVQKTGKVVYISERNQTGKFTGHLKLCPDKNKKMALFSPIDNRAPRMMLPMSDCPPNFYNRPGDYATVLFLAQIKDWKETSTFPFGRLIKSLGNVGEIEAETEGLLLENDVDFEEFPNEILNSLPQEFSIPQEEIERRQDLRSQCIFTIDPATARDMDDAVGCEQLQNGNYIVGVHIADVTYFVQDGTELDKVAQKRATSVYLVHKVVPMLPRILCDHLCSLTPGTDRLTFSVVWEMTPEAEVVNEWFGRSIINSCMKMSYEHAQSMIENPNKVWNSSEHPEIYGSFNIHKIIKSVNELNDLAVKLRKKRFTDGALRLDQTKLQFTLDSETGLPTGFNTFVQKDSNRLIEEFMLLANMSVARLIYKTFPGQALLRRHPPPQSKPMENVVSMCAALGIHLDASDSGSLQSSILHYEGNDAFSKARMLLLTHLCSKPMNCALYFCSGSYENEVLYHHYALNVPLYTHFTSPIRRYPDIIVHRLLAAALQYSAPPTAEANVTQKQASHCNNKKYNAKRVSELSAEMFLSAFIRELGIIEAKAIVTCVMDHSFDCLVYDMGIVKRVYCDKLPLLKQEFQRSQGVSMLNLVWVNSEKAVEFKQSIVMFSIVDVILTVAKHNLQIKATLKTPQQVI